MLLSMSENKPLGKNAGVSAINTKGKRDSAIADLTFWNSGDIIIKLYQNDEKFRRKQRELCPRGPDAPVGAGAGDRGTGRLGLRKRG